jgi:hypothetical protein
MLTADFPPPPKPPPATVPQTDVAWYDYAVDLQAYLARLVAALKG